MAEIDSDAKKMRGFSKIEFSFRPLRKRLNKIEKDKTSRIGPQKGLKNAKWKESRGRKIMNKDSKQKELFSFVCHKVSSADVLC